MVDKTLRYVLGKEVRIKTLGASRTDAMVSANDFPCELFLQQPIPDNFLEAFNQNLPSDIEALSIREVDASFNVIQDVTEKEYIYALIHKTKKPFESHQLAYVPGNLDIELIQEVAPTFIGEHNFNAFTYPYEHGAIKMKAINLIKTEFKNDILYFRITGKGFMRYQIRLMMGALIELGRHKITKDQIVASLKSGSDTAGYQKAPASGLILNRVEYADSLN